MPSQLLKIRTVRMVGYLLAGGTACAIAWLAIVTWSGGAGSDADAHRQGASADQASAAGPALSAIEIPRHVAELNHMAIATAHLPIRERQLELRGSLAIDAGRLVHVHARFQGQIADIATIDEPAENRTSKDEPRRPLRFMDRVTKGQTVAILWSKDLGEKKSELVDALANLQLDKEALKRIEDLVVRGATSEQGLREAERQVRTGEIAVSKAERTLRSWELTDEEIDRVKAEADRISHNQRTDRAGESNWARVEITAPIDGTIVEKNVTKGDLVDTAADLFKIADLSVLNVWLHAYEEDLPYLQRLPKPIPATIRLPANPEIGPMPGAVEGIGDIIDPLEHMALLLGHVQNPRGELRAGQFITATVTLPPEENVVEIPARALVEDGTESVVFVQDEPNEYRFRPRRVKVVRRYHDVVHILSKTTPEERSKGIEELREGDRVAASETVQLKDALRHQQLTAAESQQSDRTGPHP